MVLSCSSFLPFQTYSKFFLLHDLIDSHVSFSLSKSLERLKSLIIASNILHGTAVSCPQLNVRNSLSSSAVAFKEMGADELTPFIQRRMLGKAVVAAYLRSLQTRAAEEKNIPRPSRELMNCK